MIDFEVLEFKEFRRKTLPSLVIIKCVSCCKTVQLGLCDRNKIGGQKVKLIREAYINSTPINWECRKCLSPAINQKVADIRKSRGDKFFNLTKEQKRKQVKNSNITRAKNGTLGFQNFTKEEMVEINRKSLKHQKELGTGVYDINHQINASSISRFKKLNKIKEVFEKDIKVVDLSDTQSKVFGINYINSAEFDGVSGVWAIFAIEEDKELCLDVAETKDIGKEVRLFFRKLESGKTEKYRTISKHKDIIFKIVATDIDSKVEREVIESLYAVQNKSILWSPSPTQTIDEDTKSAVLSKRFGRKD